MKSKVLRLTVVFFVVLCSQAFASGQNEQLEQLKNHIADSEKSLNRIYNWDAKSEIYDDVISSIQKVIDSNTDKSIIADLEKLQSDWDDRAWNFYMSTKSLVTVLESAMEQRALELVKARRRNNRLDEVKIASYYQETRGDSLILTYTYKILTSGLIIGIYDDVTVIGEINMRNNTTRVLEANIK